MLDVGAIGVGNGGNQIITLAKKVLGIDVLAVNTCKEDLATLPDDIPKKVVGDGKGSGKNRDEAKTFLKNGIITLVQDEELIPFLRKDILFIVSTTGGGTGSGISPVLYQILRKYGPKANVILMGVLPKIGEALTTQVNTLEYLHELRYTLDKPTYMLYDNERLAKLPVDQMMDKINASVVADMDVIRGTYQVQTKYASIDEKDSSMLYSTSGRIVIAGLKDIKEKDLDDASAEDLLIQQFKTNTHAELQRDKKIHRLGIITNLNSKINERFDSSVPKVQEFIGNPVEDFQHIVVNEERSVPNNIFAVACGLSHIDDRINRINDRIAEIEEKQKIIEEDDALEQVNTKELLKKREMKEVVDEEKVDLVGIFEQFNI